MTNEKGAVASAAGLPLAPRDFGTRAPAVLARIGRDPEQIATAVDAAEELLQATAAACGT